jgi:ribosomal-protein-alanine N-acetyltransferase
VPFTLRDATPDDLETLWRIDQQCFPPAIAYSRSELNHFMRRRGSFTLVATQDSNAHVETAAQACPEPSRRGCPSRSEAARQLIAGFILAHAARTGHIITIDVLASARRSGLGSQLLRAAELRLHAAGSHAVTLEAATDNHPALAFYKRHGYQILQTIPAYYSTGADAHQLRKPLP